MTTSIERTRFLRRMTMRKFRHSKDWRQTYINYGGMCKDCYDVDYLELHEPFGEDRKHEGKFQQRILLCHTCHMSSEHNNWNNAATLPTISRLAKDVNIEVILHGGYDKWVKYFHLQDTFAVNLLE